MSREVVKSKQPLGLEIPDLGRSLPIFTSNDPRIKLQPRESTSTPLWGNLEGFGEIECYEVVDDSSTTGIQLPRLINIYSKISQRTAAQRLCGVLEDSGKRFVVMESLKKLTKLEESLASSAFAKIPLIKRLRFAYEICNAMVYFHSINILLKSLSTQNIFIKESHSETGHVRPVLTGLENARLVSIVEKFPETTVRLTNSDYRVHHRTEI